MPTGNEPGQMNSGYQGGYTSGGTPEVVFDQVHLIKSL